MNRKPTPARRAFRPSAIAMAFGAAALMLMAGSLAMARIVPIDPLHDTFEHNSAWSHIGDEADLPIPAVGERLFVTHPDAPQCMDRQAVVDQFQSDAAVIGGRTIEIPQAGAQAMADRWRDKVSVESVNVTNVLVHLFFDERKAEWTADLVELDEVGCAMSRTLLTVYALNDLVAAGDVAN